ncbi:hypothetical protein NKI20_31995 [Mesorhizobium sp. M0830]|uniref:hypothetical protein n=1 Tax=Mesorhizobium sp. M0830 TaxID=2957008 RepID=UPI00333ACCA7
MNMQLAFSTIPVADGAVAIAPGGVDQVRPDVEEYRVRELDGGFEDGPWLQVFRLRGADFDPVHLSLVCP